MERKSIQEIAAVLTVKSGLKKKDAERFATTLFEVVKDGLAADRLVKIKGFGTFKVIEIESRESINVNTGERVLIEGHSKITFTPDATMKELVNKPFSQFETVILNEGVEFDEEPSAAAPEPVEPEAEVPIAEPAPAAEAEAVEPMGPIEEPTPAAEAEAVEPIEEPSPAAEVEAVEPMGSIEEPAPAAEPAAVLEPEAEIESEPISESEEDSEDKEKFIVGFDEESEMYMNDRERPKMGKWIVVAALACICSFVGGYFVGTHQVESENIIDLDSIADAQNDDKAAKVPMAELKVDTPQTVAPVTETPQIAETPVAEAPVAAAAPVQTAPAKPAVDDMEKYNQMDGRVRTGAYRIVGTAEEVKVQAGETVALISRRYLGPGMDCYVEVYNGLKSTSQLKEGQIIKIPKLELKQQLKKRKHLKK